MILLSEEHGLYGVEVPGEAQDFEADLHANYELGAIRYFLNGNNLYASVGFDFQILGTVSADTIDFDCEPYVEESIDLPEYKYGGELHPKETYWNYESRLYCGNITNYEDSFRSLIESKTGKYFVNPYDKNAPWQDMKNDYEAAQQNLIQKMVILKKIT